LYLPYFSPELQAQAFLKRLERKPFQKRFDRKCLAGVIKRLNSCGSTQTFFEKA